MNNSRSRQIAEFRRRLPPIRPSAGNDNTYEFDLIRQDSTRLCNLKVHLPPAFPNTPPIISISRNLTHPWVDSNGILFGHPSLINWRPDSSNLSDLVISVLTELTKTPPLPAQSDTNTPPLPRSTPTNKNNWQFHDKTPFPPVPTSFPFLDNIPDSKLELLKDNPMMLDDLILELPHIKEYLSMYKNILKSNSEIASGTIKTAKSVKETQELIKSLQEELNEKQAKVEYFMYFTVSMIWLTVLLTYFTVLIIWLNV
eukprot:GHVL01005254.1.p1 GENE.GHVL01005254.1~~GHVL01005254.1.p1  ORF type:complete len:256 (-),score=40.12 GHVL01005254.1:90-857(-)